MNRLLPLAVDVHVGRHVAMCGRHHECIALDVHHARRVVFQLAEVAISRWLFAAILRRIERLRLLTPAPA